MAAEDLSRSTSTVRLNRQGTWFALALFGLAWLVFFWAVGIPKFKTILPLALVGSVGYLAIVVGYAVFSDADKPAHPGHQIATALALGLAFATAVAAWGNFDNIARNSITDASPIPMATASKPVNPATPPQPTASTSGNTSPSAGNTSSKPTVELSSGNVLTSALSLVLTIVALFAGKMAAGAKSDAERAKAATEETINVFSLSQASGLLALAFEIRIDAQDLAERSESAGERDEPDRKRALNLAIEALERCARLLTTLHRWVLDASTVDLPELTEQARISQMLCEKMGEQNNYIRDIGARLRRTCWAMVGRAIETLLKTEAKKLTTAGPDGLKLATALRTLRATLQSL